MWAAVSPCTAVTNDWFWIQDPSQQCKDPMNNPNCQHGGLQVLETKHDEQTGIEPGVIVEIVGKIDETGGFGGGVTFIDACTLVIVEKPSDPQSNVPEPVPVTGAMFYDEAGESDCTTDGEIWEGMLVEFSMVTVLPCVGNFGNTANDCKNNFLPGQTGPENMVWDKFQQFWFQTEDGFTIEVDDHLVQLYTQCETAVGTTWEKISGIMTYSFGSWDLIPRNKDDVVGCMPVTTGDLIQAKISDGNKDPNKVPILQLSQKYANTLEANNGEYFTPLEQLGCDQFNVNGQEGLGGYDEETAGVSQCYFSGNSCPGVAVEEPYWANVKSHSACACYPPYFYNPGPAHQDLGELSINGVGTAFVNVTAIVSYVQQADGPFYIEDSCEPDASIYVFRSGPVSVEQGDEVMIIGTTYVYYGLPELQDVVDIVILSKGNSVCPPKIVTDLTPFSKTTPHGACDDVGAGFVSNVVRLENVVVKTIFKDLESDEADAIASGDGSFPCKSSSGSSIPGGCKVELEDEAGNTMIMDDKFGFMHKLLLGVSGLNEKPPIQVGTKFDYIEGLIDITRGVYKGTGGRLVFCPFDEIWSYDGEAATSCEDAGLDADGDVNDDGVVNVLDVVGMVGYVLGNSSDEGALVQCKGDMNSDGIVNVLDIVAVVNVILSQGK
eukprot:scaffold302_cov397-Prasinococcus_capsulatus_cf.AAC.17